MENLSKIYKMKLIGLIGGTTWLSTVEYYKLLNQLTNQKLGGSHSAKLLLHSVDFEEFKPSTDLSKWNDISNRLGDIALKLQDAGAECFAFCANTPHLVADKIQQRLNIPLIHIAEATAQKIKLSQLQKVALLGTKITMEQNFFKEILAKHHIESVIPSEAERNFIHDSILGELGKGILKEQTKDRYLDIIDQLISQGAQGVILGCTEIPLLILQEDVSVPVFDTTMIHAEAIIEFALR
jgi:aspartate racemase